MKARAPLPIEQRRLIFLDVETMSYMDVGHKWKIVENFKNGKAFSNWMGKLVRDVEDNPTRFNVTEDDVKRILAARDTRIALNKTSFYDGTIVASREQKRRLGLSAKLAAKELEKATKQSVNIPSVTAKAPIKETELKDMVIQARSKSLQLLHRKLDELWEDPEQFKKLRIVELTTAFGTIFDKTQIIMGQATENIAVMAKIDKNMNAEDALSAILSMREVNQVEKEKRKD